MTQKPTEERFEEWIEQSLHTYGYSSLPFIDYDKTKCLIQDEVLEFITTTQPKKWKKLVKQYEDQTREKVLQRISSEISKRGLIDVLRNGVKDRGVYLDLVYFQPKSGLNPEHQELYEQNRFRIVRQLHYSNRNENSIDMVLFLNGLPIVTMELKNQLTGQNIKHSEYQYKNDRDPKGEPLLGFGRCLVHFCVDNNQVSMTTHLRGQSTKFFPYNKGIENPSVDDDYRSEYLWNDVLRPDSLLDIIENFVVEVEEKEYFYNEKKGDIDTKKFKVLIFPRYHQLEVIRKLRSSIKVEGVGHNYLIQHTTGSGKSYSIGWLSHTLTSLYQSRDDKKRMFDSVIVVTDRRVLDKQLQNTIKSLEKTRGVVTPIDKTSTQLKDMLEKGKDIIITTIQKFPYISDAISSIGDRTFGVVIDEVHSSQSGETSKEMKKTLSKLNVEEEEGEFDMEDYIREEIKSRGQQDHISFFGFTGTPKEKTLEVFGRKNEDGVFVPFHIYSMEQSIAEGFTLDVLKNYTTYKRYFKLKQTSGQDIELPSSEGKKELIKYVDSHEITVRQKVGIMLDHFISKGSKGIQGKGRGMIVVRSRKDCVRYYKEVNRQLKERGLKYRSLVAFSGDVKLDGQSYTETSLNKEIGHEGDIPLGLKNPKFRLLIVSNKFQTGFDEPLVQSMYVDKKLGGVQCVQTLSRLNRTKGKEKNETFVLDFVNDPEDIKSSFQKYYTSTMLIGETDQNKIYDYQRELEGYHIYTKMEIDRFCEIFYNPKKPDSLLHPILDGVVERWRKIEEEEKKEEFRSLVQSYIRLYGYISQILTYEDVEFEKLFIFLKYLNKKLPKKDKEGVPKEIMDSIELDSLRIQKISEKVSPLDSSEEGQLEPGTFEVGEPEEQYFDLLSQIVGKVNELFGEGLTEEDKIDLRNVYNKMTQHEDVRSVFEGDNSEPNKKEYFRERLNDEILKYVNERFEFYQKMEDQRMKEFITSSLFDMYKKRDGEPLQL